MSIFTPFIKDIKTFAAKIEAELAKLWVAAPTLAQVVSTTLTFVGPVLQAVVTAEAGSAAGTVVGSVIATAQQDLTAVKGLITTVGPTPTVASLLNGVKADLASLLGAAKISNPASVSNVTLVINELEALVDAFPVTSAAATPAAAVSGPGVGQAA